MPKLRQLSGSDIIRTLERFGFTVSAQRGSHVKLQRRSPSGERQTLTVPLHPELDTGTCRVIFRQAARYIPEADLRPYFYSK